MPDDLGFRGKAKTDLQTFDLAGLDFVEVVVAAHQEQPDLHVLDCACVIALFGGEYEGLHRLLQRHIQ